MPDTDIRVEYVDFEEINKWPRNPKDHDLHEIRKSFARFGFIKPVLLDEGTQKLVAGHGRLDTLRVMRDMQKGPPRGIKVVDDTWLVPVLRGVAFKDPTEAEAFLIADNRLSEIGGWDQDLLAEMLSEVVDVDDALDGMGFDFAEVMQLMGEHEIDLGGEAGESAQKGFRQYMALVTAEEYRFIIDTLDDLEKNGLTEDEYAIVNRKGFCLYKIVREWSEFRI
jgi:hypothetical protein